MEEPAYFIFLVYQRIIQRRNTALTEKRIKGFVESVLAAGNTGVYLLGAYKFPDILDIIYRDEGHIAGSYIEIFTLAEFESLIDPR
jgi:hypothetical protein